MFDRVHLAKPAVAHVSCPSIDHTKSINVRTVRIRMRSHVLAGAALGAGRQSA